MNDELAKQKKSRPSLDARFAARPEVYERLQQIADRMDQALAEGSTADEAEAVVMEQIQKLGGELLGDWASEKQQRSVAESQRENPSAIKHIKKK
jgi:secreted protein with Ig-like and vWFA domain